MTPGRHLEVLRSEGQRLAELPAEALSAPVPSLPDWTLERVVRHTGKIHKWVTAGLDAGPGADLAAIADACTGLPEGPACLPAYRESVEAVHAALACRDPHEPAATFAGAADVAFWCRRQAHEVAVHRIDGADAVHAAGGPPPAALDVEAAADGVDEWLRLFLAVRWPQRSGALPSELVGRTMHLHGTDDPGPAVGAEWVVAFTPGGVEVQPIHARGDVALRGRAEDLLLTLWRRRGLDLLDVIGDRHVAEVLHDTVRI